MRCDDCLTEFPAGADRFAVLKQMRDFEPGFDPAEARLLQSLLYDQKFVCADCAGWYGDHPIQVSAIEAGHE